MDKDTRRLAERLIHSWDGDLEELLVLVETVSRIRKRAQYQERVFCKMLAQDVRNSYRGVRWEIGRHAINAVIELIDDRINNNDRF